MRYSSQTNKALRIFFLFSVVLHLALFVFFGRMLHPPKTEYNIEVDIKTIANKKTMRNIPWPQKHLNDTHTPPLLKSQILSIPDIIHVQKKVSKLKKNNYSTNHKKLGSKPDSMPCDATPVHTIIEGIRDISIPQLPMFLTPAYTEIDQTSIYKTQILSHIKKHQKYPRAAQRRGIKGTVNVDFLLYRDGTLGDIKIIKESNHQILNNAAIESIRAGEPYPPFPSGMQGKTIRIGVPITFNLVEKTARN